MTMRTNRKTVNFSFPFRVSGIDDVLPPGSYLVETDEELLEGLSYAAYRRLATVVHLPGQPGSSVIDQAVVIDPAELEAAMMREIAASKTARTNSMRELMCARWPDRKSRRNRVMKWTTLSFLIALGMFGNSAGARAELSAFGFWLNEEQGWVIETVPCGNKVCGYLVGFRKTRSDDYAAKDSQNPDPKKRDRPLCGLMLLGGFTPSKETSGKWEDGWVYDPDNGAIYTGEGQMTDADTIKMRGYILIPLFGRTMTLIREVGSIIRCSSKVRF